MALSRLTKVTKPPIIAPMTRVLNVVAKYLPRLSFYLVKVSIIEYLDIEKLRKTMLFATTDFYSSLLILRNGLKALPPPSNSAFLKNSTNVRRTGCTKAPKTLMNIVIK